MLMLRSTYEKSKEAWQKTITSLDNYNQEQYKQIRQLKAENERLTDLLAKTIQPIPDTVSPELDEIHQKLSDVTDSLVLVRNHRPVRMVDKAKRVREIDRLFTAQKRLEEELGRVAVGRDEIPT